MITDLLARQAAERPEAPFIVTLEREYSYAAIQTAARRFATRLAGQGIGQGDHVAMLAGNGAAFVIAWLGIGLRGAVAVTLNNQLIADGLRYSVDQCDARVLVVDREWEDSRAVQLDARQAALPRLLIDSDEAFLNSLDGLAEAEPVVVPASAPCTIMYTSGTTGLPKGVVNCHTAYMATGRATVQALRLTRNDRVLVFLPLFHVNPQMYGVMSVLTAGAALLLLPRFSASSFFDDAIRLRATGCTFVGTVLSILVARQEGERRDHGIRFFFGGGAPRPVWQAVEARFGIRVHEAYGMTEVGGWATANTVDDHRFGSCGKPRPDLELRIVDADDRPVPAGQPGEIVVRPRDPDTILLGYYKKPEQMLEASRNLWFHSGDLGCLDESGFLYYLGRQKELIRKSGEMISPVEIETTLRRMCSVCDCAVVAVPDPVTGDEIKAVIVAQHTMDPASVQAFLAERLARFMLPRYIEFVAAIPKTETEKIQRNKLQYLDARVHDLKSGQRVAT
ncbi:class I adenylate-forming enzyme family protein [Rhodoferax sediminis]|uniref:ATP-dependent acyl-CoA ligase n=1 Tax=Rhodoferax sediminis TaxID=2509614 RepID=A0A515D9Z2_9BURK|nr:AMP-binding protein [Rhodoferax sediminis]QDL37232.1 ATP-dependent acyl-CoA ligase [Rhodoferax sediminis]